MKYLIWLLIALVVVWRWRSSTSKSVQAPAPEAQDPTPVAPKAVDMHACAHCGLHLPAQDMVTGTQGRYCSALHRDLAES